MNFGISGNPYPAEGPEDPHDGAIDPDGDGTSRVTSERLNKPLDTAWWPDYKAESQASGIFRVGVGDYVAVLDGAVDLSGGYNMHYAYNAGGAVANSASSVQDYIDVWTVKLYKTSEYQLFINSFSLYNDNFTTITEPLLLTTRNRLVNKKLRVGEKVDMKITTDITVQNKTLPEETKNILKDYQISGANIQIQRVNQDSVNQPAWSSVVDYDTSPPNATITSDNTILYNFDTESKAASAGTYFITAKYSYLTQNFVTPPFYFTIT